VPVAYTGAASGTTNDVNVTRRLVQVTVSVEILNRDARRSGKEAA